MDQDSSELSRKLSTRLLAFDLVVVVPVMLLWFGLVEVLDWALAASIFAALFVVRVVAVRLHLRWRLHPVSAWSERGRGCSDAELLAADEALRRGPVTHSLVYTLSWIAFFVVDAVLGRYVVPEMLAIGRGELVSGLLFAMAVACGGPLVVYAIFELYARPIRERLAVELDARGVVLADSRATLLRRLGGHFYAMVATLVLLAAMLVWTAKLQSTRKHALDEATAGVQAQLLGFARVGAEPPRERVRPFAQLPPRLQAQAEVVELVGAIDAANDRVVAAGRIDDDRWLVEVRSVELGVGEFLALILPTFVAVGMWAWFVIFMFARALTAPIDRARGLLHRLVEVGDIGAIERLPALEADELGQLTRDFNTLLGHLGRLSVTAQQLAAGKLEVEVEGEGELADAFREMVAQLHGIVVEIRRTTLDLASASSEILAATREQERAGEQQVAGMGELSETMASLARSAAQIEAAIGAVRANAGATFATTEDMATKLAELDARGRGVGELLEVIREVADRSDLLALNGALEATRAGEAGRGFALVADEMRRLAERVTGTVDDVKRLVAGIADSSADTTEATARSRELAANTTETTRRIAAESQRQREDTERVSQGVRELAAVVAQTSAATTQTRAAAEDMKDQAEQLRRMVGRFDVGE